MPADRRLRERIVEDEGHGRRVPAAGLHGRLPADLTGSSGVTAPSRASQPQAGRHRLAALRYLRGEPGRAGDHQGAGRAGGADREAIRLAARHEGETARADTPALLPAEHLDLTLEQVEHLVLAVVH